MKASEVMTVGAVTVRTDSSVAYAARVMIECGVSGLPVVDARGKLAGIITEGDLLRRKEIGTADRPGRWLDIWLNTAELAHQYAREHGQKVQDVMSPQVVSVGPDADIRDIVDLMETRRVRRVPVIRDGKVVGVVSRANLLSALARLAGDAPQPVVEDLAIRQRIIDEIAGKAWAPGSTIDILVRDGVVTLNGTVEAEQVRDAVRVAAENTPGAVRVWDNLQIVSIPDD
jgi:CBS domain-containing protein